MKKQPPFSLPNVLVSPLVGNNKHHGVVPDYHGHCTAMRRIWCEMLPPTEEKHTERNHANNIASGVKINMHALTFKHHPDDTRRFAIWSIH